MAIKKNIFGLIFFLSLLFVIILQQSPNYYASYKTPTNYIYVGQASWFDPWDINAYVSAIKEGQMGHIFLKNVYSTESHKAALFYPTYTLIGFLFRSVNPFLLFHGFAILTSACLFIVLYRLSQFFIKDKRYGLFATVLASIGGGMGWLFYPAVQSADLAVTGFTFHSAFQRPHEALGVLLYLSSLSLFYRYIQREIKRDVIASLLCMILLVIFYPYYLVSYALICGSFIYFSQESEKKQRQYKLLGINVFIVALITVVYFFHLFSTGFSSVVTQSLSHPTLLALLLGYGLFFPIFIYQFWLLKYHRPERLFLVIWIFLSLALAFIPIGIARFYLRGLFFPLSLLLISTLRASKNQIVKSALIFIVISFFAWLSSFHIWYRRVEETNRINSWYYQPEEMRDVFTILEKAPKDGVLSGYIVGNLLPPHTGKHVYFGHYIQTPQAEDKIEKITAFYEDKTTTSEARQFLKSNAIYYVIYGAEEKKLGNLDYSFLKPVYKSAKITLYEVR